MKRVPTISSGHEPGGAVNRVKSLLRIKTLHDDLEGKKPSARRFGRYVSEEVAAEIIADPERQLKLGGEKREGHGSLWRPARVHTAGRAT